MFHYHTGCEEYRADDDWEQVALVLSPETVAVFPCGNAGALFFERYAVFDRQTH